jgi:hypothetical protein
VIADQERDSGDRPDGCTPIAAVNSPPPRPSPEAYDLYNLLESEVLSLAELCSEFESDSRYEWDVPTACEWFALADCKVQPFPWGWEAPTPARANLKYGRDPSKLRPVGSHPLGATRHGVHDCCGNVHEIVRIAESGGLPEAFRLAGGCYKNVPSSTCFALRPFKKKSQDVRQNVGLRLVRYERSLAPLRFTSLRKYTDEIVGLQKQVKVLYAYELST